MQQNQSRQDEAMAVAVEAGIAMADVHGRASAAKYMAVRHVPDTVIARVLCEPAQRRARPLSAPGLG